MTGLVVVGLNIKSAPIEALERLSVHHSVAATRLAELLTLDCVRGAVILSTCNRLELYAAAGNGFDAARCVQALRGFLLRAGGADGGLVSGSADGGTDSNSVADVTTCGDSADAGVKELETSLYSYEGEAAVRHLYRVVSGLDSLVLGETEILGQVARAYELALGLGATDKVLNVCFQRALGVGKQVRTEAGIDQYHTSVGRIAVDLAEQELGSIKDKQILVLGAGEMSELTMKHLVSKAAPLVMVSNRSLSRARALAAEFGFETCALDDLAFQLERADIVFSATSSKQYLVTCNELAAIMEKRQGRPLVFIDMAVPRDIDPLVASLPGVMYFDIKQIRDVSDQNRSLREQAAQELDVFINKKVLSHGDGESDSSVLRIGTRGSQLALWQAHWVAKQLSALYPEVNLQVVAIKTAGDEVEQRDGAGVVQRDGVGVVQRDGVGVVQRDGVGVPLFGTKSGTPTPSLCPTPTGLFTSELEAALLDGSIDLAVHSLKDLPSELSPGLEIAAYCKREDPRDVLISKGGLTLAEMPAGALIGTASPRRTAQILAFRPDLKCVPLRGNLDTRLRKLDEAPDSELLGIVVAAAGVHRMGWQSRISEYLNEDVFVPSAGQGIIAVEVSAERADLRDLLAPLNHQSSKQEARAERAFLHSLQAGCQAPVGAHAVYSNDSGVLVLKVMVASLDGSNITQATTEGTNPELIGRQAASQIPVPSESVDTKERVDA